LLQHGADPNLNYWSQAGWNDDPAGYLRTTDLAIQNGSSTTLSLLIEDGGIVGNHFSYADGSNRATSLNIVLRTKSPQVAGDIGRILVEHAERNCDFQRYLKMSFEIALEAAEMEHCALLLNAGLNRIAAMHWAIRAGNEALCRILAVDYQVDPFAQESNDKEHGDISAAGLDWSRPAASSPFLAAARLHDPAILQLFLQQWDERYNTSSVGNSSAAAAAAAGIQNDNREYPIHLLCRDKYVSLQALGFLIVESDQADTLIIADAEQHLLPFVSAAVSDASLNVIFYLLQQCPDALKSSRLVKQTN
jgi:hypothetical protein